MVTASIAALRPNRSISAPEPAETHRRSARRRIIAAWVLLFLNTLTFYPGTWMGEPLIVPIPHRIGQLITQGALVAALLLVLSVNRRLLIRPNAFLCILSLLIVGALISALGHPASHMLGTMYRTVRFAAFVVTLWLMTPWWGRRDMLFLKCQIASMWVAIAWVLLGLMVSPGRALAGGRLAGTFWPTPPTQVADFAAATLGLAVVLWLTGLWRGRLTLISLVVLGITLLMTHSRTELIAMIAGILVSGLSLFTAKARVRRFFAATSVIASSAITLFSGLLTSWLARGQGARQISELTGRTVVWKALIAMPRDVFHLIFGFGLSNDSFNGLPIDSTWLSAYLDFGFVGVAFCAMMVLFVLIAAAIQPRSPQRAIALYLATYLLVRSFTETGLELATANLLDLAVAASLLLPSIAARRATRWPAPNFKASIP